MNSVFYTELGKELQSIRKSLGMSQQIVADRMKVTRSCVANWEQGQRQINIDDIYKLCDIYNIDINELTKRVRKYLYK